MPNLRCPECYYTTTCKAADVINAACNRCGENLYDHYYAGRTEEETKEFILAENTRLKRKKNRADRQRRERDNQSTPQEKSIFSYISLNIRVSAGCYGFPTSPFIRHCKRVGL